MLFNSYIFVLLFLPVTVFGYFALNKMNRFSASKVWLIIMSLFFYAYFNVKYLLIIVSSVIFNYFFGKLLLKSSKALKKCFLIVAVFFNIAILFYYKYLNFFIDNINLIFSTDFVFEKILLPLGISFFTFQQISFIIDSYKNNVPQYKFTDYALFVTFFPQLIAGPIVLHNEIIPQFNDINKKKFNYENFSKGLYAFALGLAKKVLVADAFGRVVDFAYADTDYFLNTSNAIIIMLSYTFQIYFDFSGYCDMATGLGLMFNINIPINFNSPYKSLDDSEFWKRWHITLTRFFTNYIYIPLGGNRKGKRRMYINTMIVFIVSGIWHGANWTFIIWGIIHGIAVLLCKIFRNTIEKIPKVIKWPINFLFLNFTWIIFRAQDIRQFLFIVKHILICNFQKISGELVENFYSNDLIYIDSIIGLKWLKFAFAFAFIILAAFACIKCKNTNEKLESFEPNIKNGFVTVALIAISILSFSEISSFLYFNF